MRKNKKNGRRRLRAPCLLLTVLLLAGLWAAAFAEGPARVSAEEMIPPSPEPPSGEGRERPTPAPTAVPHLTLVDHVNRPDVLPDFAFQEDAQLLHIWFPDIRDADAAVLCYGGETVMIDCGDEKAAKKTALLLDWLGLKKIDVLFTSHLHHDHVNGLARVDDACRVGEVRVCFATDETESGLLLAQTAQERGIPVKTYQNGDVFSLGKNGEVTLTFWLNEDETLDMNSRSAQTMVALGERRVLFTADMERKGQLKLLEQMNPALLRCDIVKYPHHGKTAMAEAFYQALSPRLAVVTSVKGRGDPGQTWLNMKKLPTAYTSEPGTCVHLVTDGVWWLCERVQTGSEEEP